MQFEKITGVQCGKHLGEGTSERSHRSMRANI